MKEFIIYDHISPSGKHYIGQTCQKPQYRWGVKGKNYLKLNEEGKFEQILFARAILKYGWDNFEHKILFTKLSALDANMIEEDLIHYYTKQGISYNIRTGGKNCSGWRMSEEGRQNISKAKMGDKNPNYHKHPSKEVLKKQIQNRSIPVIQYSKDSIIIKEWLSATVAGRELSIDPTNICRTCKGERKTAGGYKWEYKDKEA